jgi:hypothetical protein
MTPSRPASPLAGTIEARMPSADEMLAVAASRAEQLAVPGLDPHPRRKVAVLACMDTRIDLFPASSAATRTSSATPAGWSRTTRSAR